MASTTFAVVTFTFTFTFTSTSAPSVLALQTLFVDVQRDDSRSEARRQLRRGKADWALSENGDRMLAFKCKPL